MKGLVVVTAVCVMLVACLASAGEVVKTVTIEKTMCVAGVCHPAACSVRERIYERRACRVMRNVCDVEVPVQKTEANNAVQKTITIKRIWFRNGRVGCLCE